MNSTIRRFYILLALALAAGGVVAAPQDDFAAGQKAYYAGDVVGAMPLLKRAADAGHAQAQSLYAYILDKADYTEEAVRYFRLAAKQGDPEGQFGLGALYAVGQGVPRDPVEARQWFERAGEQQHAPAVIALSDAFLNSSLGFKAEPTDPGLPWVRKAAALGSLPALSYLAKGYRSGAFGAPDIAEAERLEARIREISPDRKKGRQKK